MNKTKQKAQQTLPLITHYTSNTDRPLLGDGSSLLNEGTKGWKDSYSPKKKSLTDNDHYFQENKLNDWTNTGLNSASAAVGSWAPLCECECGCVSGRKLVVAISDSFKTSSTTQNVMEFREQN
ncbi:hypothetical protein BLNAU_7003 [Blattamonas nauphoetae]|uniref:Uncharacterized protein n=1 Tax=Blattamonas nauphoetae TaxID=2049346 RepID=A0ABQ9Y2V3_9EUKA|nr:hypothetical protein BLNAU_7003 [Blattamonas nauphoetae]